MITAETHYLSMAAAYARGAHPDLAGLDDAAACAAAASRGERLYRFKRNAELPRVRAVLGILRGLCPASLLDVGSGRGTFLWPLLDEAPSFGIGPVPVTSLEGDPERHRQLACAASGGAFRASRGDARSMPFASGSFDVVTILEVLEHMTDSERAAAECLRVAGRWVVASCPSKPDDNPEHVRLFEGRALETMFLDLGARKARSSNVPGHVIVVAEARA